MEIKFQAPDAIDAMLSPCCVCSIASRFHAIDATMISLLRISQIHWLISTQVAAEPEQGLEHGLRDHVSSTSIPETLDLHGTLLAMERFD